MTAATESTYRTEKLEALGTTQINGATYIVYRLPVGEATARAGMRNQFALESPKGAQFLVVDYGPKFQLNSVCVAGAKFRNVAPRQLRGLTREHLAAFGVEAR